MPLYPLYALLIADAGVSPGRFSLLFAVWSAVGVVAEVPTGALADRFSRRLALAGGCALQAAGFALWLLVPRFAGFLCGFVVWGVGGALGSGALEALLYDELLGHGAADRYAEVQGHVTAAELAGQLPAAGLATVLYAAGGYGLVGWVSVGGCLLAAVAVLALPETPRHLRAAAVDEQEQDGYLATLLAGCREVAASRVVRGAVLAVAAVAGLDAVEEYLPVIARDATVATQWVPLAVLAVPAAGAGGAWLAGTARRWRTGTLAAAVAGAFLLLGAAALVRRPAALAGIAVAYAAYRLVLVVVTARLQERIASASRATVTSVAALGTEVSGLAVFAAWALGGALPVAGVGVAAGAGVLWWLRR